VYGSQVSSVHISGTNRYASSCYRVNNVKCVLVRCVQEELATIAPVVGGDVTIRRVDFESIIDNVRRAAHAIRQAQKLSSAATRAFGDEAANVEQVVSSLQSVMLNSST